MQKIEGGIVFTLRISRKNMISGVVRLWKRLDKYPRRPVNLNV